MARMGEPDVVLPEPLFVRRDAVPIATVPEATSHRHPGPSRRSRVERGQRRVRHQGGKVIPVERQRRGVGKQQSAIPECDTIILAGLEEGRSTFEEAERLVRSLLSIRVQRGQGRID